MSTPPVLDREQLCALGSKWLDLLGGLDPEGKRDLPAILDILAEDIDYEIPFLEKPARFLGKAAVFQFMESMQGMFADIVYNVETIYADVEAQTLIFEMTASRIVRPQNVPYSNRYIFRMTVTAGLVSAIREYVNPLPAQELSRRLQLV